MRGVGGARAQRGAFAEVRDYCGGGVGFVPRGVLGLAAGRRRPVLGGAVAWPQRVRVQEIFVALLIVGKGFPVFGFVVTDIYLVGFFILVIRLKQLLVVLSFDGSVGVALRQTSSCFFG